MSARYPAYRGDEPCVALGVDAYFSGGWRQQAAAVDACRDCPLVAACLAYALEHEPEFGIWGGMTAEQRRQLVSG